MALSRNLLTRHFKTRHLLRRLLHDARKSLHWSPCLIVRQSLWCIDFSLIDSEEVSHSYSYVYSVEPGLTGSGGYSFLGSTLGFGLGFELSPIVIIPDTPQSGVPVETNKSFGPWRHWGFLPRNKGPDNPTCQLLPRSTKQI